MPKDGCYGRVGQYGRPEYTSPGPCTLADGISRHNAGGTVWVLLAAFIRALCSGDNLDPTTYVEVEKYGCTLLQADGLFVEPA